MAITLLEDTGTGSNFNITSTVNVSGPTSYSDTDELRIQVCCKLSSTSGAAGSYEVSYDFGSGSFVGATKSISIGAGASNVVLQTDPIILPSSSSLRVFVKGLGGETTVEVQVLVYDISDIAGLASSISSVQLSVDTLPSAVDFWAAAQDFVVPLNNTTNTVMDAFHAMLVEVKGRHLRQGVNFTKFKRDGTTYIGFILDNSESPGVRTPIS